MSVSDPYLLNGAQGFLLPTLCGGLCYAAATLGARYISPVPRHIYISRLVLIFVLSVPLFYYFMLRASLVTINGHGPSPRNIGTFYGNRAWMARSIFLAPESLPPLKARACSLIVGCIGFAVALLAAAHHVTSVLKSSSRPSAGFDVLLVLAALLPGVLVLHALRTGTGFWRFGILDREETPLLFWVYVVLNVCAFLGMLSMML